MIYGTILCLGDSQTRGARTYLGWPELLAERMTERTGTEWSAINAGVNREQTRQILDRTPGMLAQLQAMAGAKWIIVMAGTNDFMCIDDDRTMRDARIAFRQILRWVRRTKIPFVVMSPPNTDGVQMPQFSASKLQRDAWAQVVREEAGDAPFIDLGFIDPRQHMCDGVHFSDSGNDAVVKVLVTFMTSGKRGVMVR